MDSAPKKKKKPQAHSPDDKKALGGQIAAVRKAAGFATQVEVAAELQVVKQTVSQWESGANLPDALWVRRLARLFKASADELVGNSAGAWPFSRELLSKVRGLKPDDLQALEIAMWAHLHASKEMPAWLTGEQRHDAAASTLLAQKIVEAGDKAIKTPIPESPKEDEKDTEVGRR